MVSFQRKRLFRAFFALLTTLRHVIVFLKSYWPILLKSSKFFVQKHIVRKILGIIRFRENSIFGQIDHKEEQWWYITPAKCSSIHILISSMNQKTILNVWKSWVFYFILWWTKMMPTGIISGVFEFHENLCLFGSPSLDNGGIPWRPGHKEPVGIKN